MRGIGRRFAAVRRKDPTDVDLEHVHQRLFAVAERRDHVDTLAGRVVGHAADHPRAGLKRQVEIPRRVWHYLPRLLGSISDR